MSWSAAARVEEPDHANDVLEEIRQKISASDDDLNEARERRDLVLKAARSFPARCDLQVRIGRPRQRKQSGGRCGRWHGARPPRLRGVGPDSDKDEGPEEIVDDVREHVMGIVRETYPSARSRLIKRAILIRFNEPNADGVDPSVDLVVAITRKNANGLWIPNRDKDDWDASDPEEHRRLLTGDRKNLRVHRARVIRLAKAAIKHDSTPALISFNIEALALEHITKVNTLAASLQLFFDKAASSIKSRPDRRPGGCVRQDQAARRHDAQALVQAPAPLRRQGAGGHRQLR